MLRVIIYLTFVHLLCVSNIAPSGDVSVNKTKTSATVWLTFWQRETRDHQHMYQICELYHLLDDDEGFDERKG